MRNIQELEVVVEKSAVFADDVQVQAEEAEKVLTDISLAISLLMISAALRGFKQGSSG